MTLEEYYIYSQNNQNDKVRYEKSNGSKESKITTNQNKDSDIQSSKSEQFLNPNKGNMLNVPKGTNGSSFKTRPKTGKQTGVRMLGDFTKVKLLQDEKVDKKVNFNASNRNSSIHSHLIRTSKFYILKGCNLALDVSRINPQNPAFTALAKKRGVRPKTAKNFYTQNQRKIKENKESLMVKNTILKGKENKMIKNAVIKYNELEKKGIISQLIIFQKFQKTKMGFH